MAYGDRTICKAPGCGQEIVQIGGGHRQRLYCDDNCRQRAFQARREQEHREEVARRWSKFTPETRSFLDWLSTYHGYGDLATAVETVINRELEQLASQHEQEAAALREKQLTRVDKLKMSKSDVRTQLEQARADLLQIRAERAREQEEIHTLSEHTFELKSKLAAARQQIKDLEAKQQH